MGVIRIGPIRVAFAGLGEVRSLAELVERTHVPNPLLAALGVGGEREFPALGDAYEVSLEV